MMQNGMPGQGQGNGMQRPQQGNMDGLPAQIIRSLQAELPKFQHQWQATVDLRHRTNRVVQMHTQLRFLESDPMKCLRTALQYENETITKAENVTIYDQVMMRKLGEISVRRNQNAGNMPFNANGGQMALNQNPAGQMNPRAQQPPNMGMPSQQMGHNGMNQLGAPGMQPSMSQNNNQQQQPHMNATPGPQQGAQVQPPNQQEIQEVASRMMASLTDDKKAQIRNQVMRGMNEQQRQHASATRKDPLIQYIFTKARQEVMGRRASAQANAGQPQQNMQMNNAGGVNMSQSASQQGSNFDFTGIMSQQANAMKLQESGNEVVPASNNPNNAFNGQINQQNGPSGGINPAMLGNGNGNGQNGSQMPPNMTREQMQMFVAQREKIRADQLRNANSNNAAKAQAMQQAQLHGQNMGTQNALNGAAGGSPAMTMLNRPMQPPGSQTPNTPSQPNRGPNMQQPNAQQVPTPGSGPNALMQHHQSMVNRNNSGVNMQALVSSLPPNPLFQLQQVQNILRTMPPPIIEKLRSTPPEAAATFVKQWAAAQSRRNQNSSMQMGGSQGGNQASMSGMPNGMPDMNMQQGMGQQGQPQLPPGMDHAQLQARMQHQQQQQHQQQLHQQQQQQQQQQQNQQSTPMQQIPANVVDSLPPILKHQAMLSRPFPPPVPQQLGIAVPPQMRLWGHLKSHIDQNQNALQPGTSQRFNAMITKWFQDHPEEFQAGIRMVVMNRQNQQQQQQQAQGQNAGQPNHNNMGMPSNGSGGAPTAQMMQPTPQMQQGSGGPPMGPGQGQVRMPQPAPVGPQDIAMFRQKVGLAAQQMTDDQIRNHIEQLRRKGMADQNMALKQAQMQNQLSQNVAGNQQARPNRTPAQASVEQAPVSQQQQQAGQKRPQPPSTANDDVMEIPNPNAQQPAQAKARPPHAGMKLPNMPNLTPEQISKLSPEQREQWMKRFESLRQANAGAGPVQNGVAAPIQAPVAPQHKDPKTLTNADIDAQFKRLYSQINQQKGPPVQPDNLEQLAVLLRKCYKTYSQIDKVLGHAMRLPEDFPEERIKKLLQAKVTVYQNWNPATDTFKPGLSINLPHAIAMQRLVGEFLSDLSQAKSRGQLNHINQQFAQQAQNQGQQQQQKQQAVAKQAAGQAPAMDKSASKHGRKASSSSKPPPAPTDNKSFDWGVGAPSPHGIPKYESGSNQLTPDKLKFPPNKRRRTGQPESAEGTPSAQAGTPSGASPGVGAAKSNSPEQLRKAQIQARIEAEERDKKRWKCTKDPACEASITGFETEDELKQHFDSIHKEIENPLQFLLDSAAETLGVDVDGKPLPGKAADKPKIGARLLPPKAAAMKRESSLTPAIKQEVRTPAGQVITPATPGSGSKLAKTASKPGVAIADTDKPSKLHDEMSGKMGYQPVDIIEKDAFTSESLPAEDRLWNQISKEVLEGLKSFGAPGFDGISGAHVDEWALRPDEPTVSSPETTPESSNASQNSDVSSNDRLRINLEWDPFSNGDVAVPEALNVAVGDLGLGASGDAEKKDAADDKATASVDDPFAWNAGEQLSWENMLSDLPTDDGDFQFDFTSGPTPNEVDMKFSF